MAGRVSRQKAREHETQAWELRQRGWTESRIAALMGLTQQGVSGILIRVEKRVLRELSERVELLKARQTAMLEHLYDEAVRAWERSQEPAKKLQEVATAGGKKVGKKEGAGETTATRTLEERVGDVRYLVEAREVLADIRGLWGLGVAVKAAQAGPEDGNGGMTDYERCLRINTLFERARARLAAREPRGTAEGTSASVSSGVIPPDDQGANGGDSDHPAP